MRKLRHPNVVELRHCFYSHGQKVRKPTHRAPLCTPHQFTFAPHRVLCVCVCARARVCLQPDELYLNLVMEYVPETVYRVTRHYQKRNEHVPILSVKVCLCVSTCAACQARLLPADVHTRVCLATAVHVSSLPLAGLHSCPGCVPP